MAKPTPPNRLFKIPFCNSGTKEVIAESNPVSGHASLEDGFPVETQLPLHMGGVAPNRLSFNGILYMLSAFAYWQQSGGQFAWSSALNYDKPSMVYHASKMWWCLAANGPDNLAGVVTPGSNSSVWQDLLMALANQMAEGGGGGGGGGGGSLTEIFGGNPVGTIIMFYGTTAPSGYLACDGSAFSASAYPKLRQVLGASFAPDLRGYFVRGLGGSSGALGAVQQDAGRNATGSYPYGQDADTPTGYKKPGSGALDAGSKWADTTNYLSEAFANVAVNWYSIELDLSKSWGSAHTASEFRPVNKALLYCIKHD